MVFQRRLLSLKSGRKADGVMDDARMDGAMNFVGFPPEKKMFPPHLAKKVQQR